MCEYCEKANEEKAIEHLKNYPTNWIFPNVDKMAIDTVLELIEKQQAELEKKDKIIEEMAKAFKQDDIRSIDEIIKYFTNKVERNNK